MRKLFALVVLFLILGGLAWWQVQKSTTQKDSYAEEKHTMFAVQDIDQIQRVFLANREGRRVLLERIEDLNWTYTDQETGKTYRANPGVVYTLLQTLHKVRVREPINKSAVDNAVRSLASQQTKVEVYTDAKEPIRVYYVGAMTDGATGNYLIMEGSERPYVGYIPNFQGTIDTRFLIKDANWRDRAIVRLDPKDLEFVEVAYQAPEQRAASFRIAQKGENNYEVTAIDEGTTVRAAELLNQVNAETFIEDFDVISAEMLIFNKHQRDTVITSIPFAVVTYKATYHNEPQIFRIYPVVNPEADRGDGLPGHRQKIQRYFIDIDEDNFFLAQHLVIRSMLWDYRYFFQEAPVQLVEDEAHTVRVFPDDKPTDPQRLRLVEE